MGRASKIGKVGKISKVGKIGSTGKAQAAEKREIRALGFVLGGVFAGVYLAAGLTMFAVYADEAKITEEQAAVYQQEVARQNELLRDAELAERAEVLLPVMENLDLLPKERIAALGSLELKYEVNQELQAQEIARLQTMISSCGGE
ncbi:MAG: hypothetical protein LBM12_02485 [Candidatus Nomurabacteria bacterium]|jgi:hypothetical protein|nr:hypothetical protein [Candidatus Nomurabacteria bacterium]